MHKLIVLIGLILILSSCGRKGNTENILLYADREAPLGWIHLTIFKDSTFEYQSRGMGNSKVWKGKTLISKDSIRFEYYDSIPIVGARALHTEKYIEFLDVEGNGRIEIKINKLKFE